MYFKSHKWVDKPQTVYERRRELRVRESKHTVMLFDKRYQDIDTGKFNTDKLSTLNCVSWDDLMQTEKESNFKPDEIKYSGFNDFWTKAFNDR